MRFDMTYTEEEMEDVVSQRRFICCTITDSPPREYQMRIQQELEAEPQEAEVQQRQAMRLTLFAAYCRERAEDTGSNGNGRA